MLRSQLVLTEIPIGVSLTYILRINTSPAMVSKQRTFRFINESIDKEKHLSSVDECPDKEIVSAEMKEKIKLKLEQDKKISIGKEKRRCGYQGQTNTARQYKDCCVP